MRTHLPICRGGLYVPTCRAHIFAPSSRGFKATAIGGGAGLPHLHAHALGCSKASFPPHCGSPMQIFALQILRMTTQSSWSGYFPTGSTKPHLQKITHLAQFDSTAMYSDGWTLLESAMPGDEGPAAFTASPVANLGTVAGGLAQLPEKTVIAPHIYSPFLAMSQLAPPNTARRNQGKDKAFNTPTREQRALVGKAIVSPPGSSPGIAKAHAVSSNVVVSADTCCNGHHDVL